jgi:hypothetical protein
LPSAKADPPTQTWTNSPNFQLYVFAISLGVLLILLIFFLLLALRRANKWHKNIHQDSSQPQIYSQNSTSRRDEIVAKALRNVHLLKAVGSSPFKSPAFSAKSFWELDKVTERYRVPQNNTDQPPLPPNPSIIHISENSQQLHTTIYSSMKEAKYFPENNTDQPPLPPNSGIIHISENSQQLPTTLDMRRKEAKYF